VGTIGHKSRWYRVVRTVASRHDPARVTAPKIAETLDLAPIPAPCQGLLCWHSQRDSNPCRHLESDPWADFYGW